MDTVEQDLRLGNDVRGTLVANGSNRGASFAGSWHLLLVLPRPDARYTAASTKLEPNAVVSFVGALQEGLASIGPLTSVAIGGTVSRKLAASGSAALGSVHLEVQAEAGVSWLRLGVESDRYVFYRRLTATDVSRWVAALERAPAIGLEMVEALRAIAPSVPPPAMPVGFDPVRLKSPEAIARFAYLRFESHDWKDNRVLVFTSDRVDVSQDELDQAILAEQGYTRDKTIPDPTTQQRLMVYVR